ncbi:MAG: LacI family transcriptional regulator [Chloroflexi bacterium]|nr:LacI family transcriptional regulator [Chloroflexota bacterium]
MSITIKDISKKLGISVSTVSKALNGYPDVSEGTRERIMEMARELDYYPNLAAQSLRRGRTNKIGLLINNPLPFVSEYIADIISGAALTAEQQGNNLVLYTTAVTHPNELRRICRAREVDGLMIIFTPPPDVVAVLHSENMPFIIFGRRVEQPGVSFVASDNRAGAYALTQHLIEQGHRRIGFTTRPILKTVSDDRFAGYQQALADAGIPFNSDLVLETIIEEMSGYKAMNAFLDMAEPPTAVFTFYDLMAVNALDAAHDRGRRVPEDVAVAGFDGLRSSLITTPRITTVQQPLTAMGQRSMELLLIRIEDNAQPPVSEIFPVELIVRQSTRYQLEN